jgi:hypothetical protein
MKASVPDGRWWQELFGFDPDQPEENADAGQRSGVTPEDARRVAEVKLAFGGAVVGTVGADQRRA